MEAAFQVVGKIYNDYPKSTLVISLFLIIAIIMGLIIVFLNYCPGAKESINRFFEPKPNIALFSADPQNIEKLNQIQNELAQLTQTMSSNNNNKEQTVICGLNSPDLKKFELSVVTGNKYNLKLGNKVIISNKVYGENSPSAIFKVTQESSKRNDSSPEICMSEETALALDIPNPTVLGKFTVSVKKIEMPNEK